MKISLDANKDFERVCLFKKGMNTDEEIIRRELIRVWTRLLEKYARPGVAIPSLQDLWCELIKKGVDAAVSAVVDEHWLVFSWMIRDEIQKKVERGVVGLDLEKIVEDVRIAQHDPEMLNYLKQQIRNHLLFDDLNWV